jgi:hypothetical protein
VQDRNAWANLTTGAWCYYYNESYNGSKYGKLYNWYAVNDPRGLAPNGYHIPTNAEWTTLIDYLGGEDVAGTKMKSLKGWKSTTSGGSKTCSNCSSWNAEYRKKVPCHTCKDTRSVSTPNITNSGNGSNSSGFSGLPGGMRYENGAFLFSGDYGRWWSSSERGTSSAWSCNLDYDVRSATLDYTNDRRYGLSVRCIRD